MILPSLHRHLFKVFSRGLSLGVVRVWMSFPGLGSAVTFAQLVIFSFCRRFMQNSVVARGGWQGGKPRNRDEDTQLTGIPLT